MGNSEKGFKISFLYKTQDHILVIIYIRMLKVVQHINLKKSISIYC